MVEYEIVKLREAPYIIPRASRWFSNRFGIREKVYRQSMISMAKANMHKKGKIVPQWYVAMEGKYIIGGLGVIENDYHDRPDLAPNVCAVYTEEEYRGKGIAGALLKTVCEDMGEFGFDTLYLVTDHIGFYERYGWKFHCMVKGSDGSPTRMYIHRQGGKAKG